LLYDDVERWWQFLEIKIVCKNENYEKYKKMLEKSGFVISNNAKLLFKEEDYSQDTFICDNSNEFEIIHFSQVIYIESYGHDIYLHTLSKQYSIKEKLYEVEGILGDKGFIRINKSTIVSKHGIKRIKPSLNGRIDLVLRNDKTVYVSKNYSKQFKEFIGF
jgi:two-component system response regulator LytT